jgi:ubiquinone/menaquinone biosynthesis C-methylase UbiE
MGRIYDATWGRGFSAIYDRAMKSTEEAGMREIRREALAAASGRTIDIGAGTGLNVELYPEGITELVLAEPDEHMLKHLWPKLGESGRAAEAVQAPAERLPFDDDSFDTAVFTLVLCTVPDPRAALAEAARVLKPGGRLLFVEHVRSKPRRSTSSGWNAVSCPRRRRSSSPWFTAAPLSTPRHLRFRCGLLCPWGA